MKIDNMDEQKEEKDQKEEKEQSPLDPSHIYLLSLLLGSSISDAQQLMERMIALCPTPPETPSLEQHKEEQPPPSKKRKREETTAVFYREKVGYQYLRLVSGLEFYFKEDDGTDLVLPIWIEPHPYLRKLVSSIPVELKSRLHYLAQFTTVSDEENQVEDVDILIEEVQTEEEIQVVNRSTIFSNLKEQLLTTYLKEIKLRTAFRKLWYRWKIYQMNKKYKKEVDPITLSFPEKEVCVYDFPNKKKYLFDAKALARYMETTLAYHEGGFAAPQLPKNPWTNESFSYSQLVSLYDQFKYHGELYWGMITLRKYGFNLSLWHNYHKSTLTLEAIKTSLRTLDSADARDLLEDFILLKLEEEDVDITDSLTNAYRIAMRRDPNHWYIQYWKSLAWMHYESAHFSRNRTRVITRLAKELLRKQHRFLRDLVHKKWIPPMRIICYDDEDESEEE